MEGRPDSLRQKLDYPEDDIPQISDSFEDEPDSLEGGMRQIPGPPGDHLRVSQFVARKPYHHIITPGYKLYKEACERAHKGALSMMNEEKDKGTFNPATFVTDVWQKGQPYLETGRLWKVYLDEVREKMGDEWVEPIKEIRERVRKVA